MEIYLIDEANNYTFRYPVAPLNEIKITEKKRYTTHEIVDFGTIDLPQLGEEMEEINFKTIFPKYYDSSYCNYSDLPNPHDIKNKFNQLKNSDLPLRLIITEIGINELVYLSEFSYAIKAGEIDDLYIENTFRRYREASINNPNTLQPFGKNSIQSFQSFMSTERYVEDIIKPGDKVRVNTKSINIHSEPDLTSSNICSLRQLQIVTVIRVQGKRWGNIAAEGKSAWIELSDVSKYEQKEVSDEE